MLESQHEGDQVEDHRSHVEYTMRETNPSLGAVGIAPVRKTSNDSTEHS